MTKYALMNLPPQFHQRFWFCVDTFCVCAVICAENIKTENVITLMHFWPIPMKYLSFEIYLGEALQQLSQLLEDFLVCPEIDLLFS